VEQPTHEALGVPDDDLALPVGEHDRRLVLAPRPCCANRHGQGFQDTVVTTAPVRRRVWTRPPDFTARIASAISAFRPG
jgi:hypothetical protein